MNQASLRAPRRRRGRRLAIATSMLALVSGALTVAVAPVTPVATVRAVTPGTTTFNDINPDNGPGLPLTECPNPCASQHNGGRVNGLAVSPGLPEGLAPDTYYAASEVGGLFKSTDGGDTWTRLTTGLPAGPLGRIGIDTYRKNGNIVYASIEGPSEGRGGAVNPETGEPVAAPAGGRGGRGGAADTGEGTREQ